MRIHLVVTIQALILMMLTLLSRVPTGDFSKSVVLLMTCVPALASLFPFKLIKRCNQ
jgi:hypothetical protein